MVRALRLLGATREPVLAAHLGQKLWDIKPLCRSLEKRGVLCRDTSNPIRWRLTAEARVALDQDETEGDGNG